jgi:phosphate starvation-inducible membrane PsiE
MIPPRTKALALQIAGLIAMLLALLDDSYLHMPFLLFVAVAVTGIVCLILSYRLRRATHCRPASIILRQKHQRFALFVAAALLGCILVSFLPASGTSHLSPTARVLSSLGAMAFVIAILAWKIYFSRATPRNGPNQSLQPTAGRSDD